MFSLVIPVYRNEDNIPDLLGAIDMLHEKIGPEFEAIFVVDGSPDSSYLRLREALPNAAFSSQLVALSRNFGSFAAIRAGLEIARGEAIAVMAADLQEPPHLILEMRDALIKGKCDVAYGVRTARADGFFRQMLAQMFWGMYRHFITSDIPSGGVDIFGVTSKVRDQVLSLGERNSSLVGLLFWVGFRRQGFPYERGKREIGTSSWTFKKRWKYMLDSIFSFSDLPIVLLLVIGSTGLVLSTIMGLLVLSAALLGTITVPGYAATMLIILVFGSLQIFSMGVLGVYLWRVFENTKGRPSHIVMSSEAFDASPKGQGSGK